MWRMIIGTLCICGGMMSGLRDGLGYGLTGIAIGILLVIWGYKDQNKKQEEQAAVEQAVKDIEEKTVKTFTFRLTGVTHECKFGRPGTHRQRIIGRHRVGDICLLKIYEWEGNPAVAVVDRKTGEDLGVVPAQHTMKVVELMEKYDTTARITASEVFEYRDNNYTTFEIQIACMNSTT